MKFSNWTLDELIHYLNSLKSAPPARLDWHCKSMVYGEIFVYNGEPKKPIEGDYDNGILFKI